MMYQDRVVRRSFLALGLTAVGGCLFLAGCDGASKEPTLTKQDDPNEKARDSMNFYKKEIAKTKQHYRPQ